MLPDVCHLTDTPTKHHFPQRHFPFPPADSTSRLLLWDKALGLLAWKPFYLPSPPPGHSGQFFESGFLCVVLALLEFAFVDQIGLELMEICLPLPPWPGQETIFKVRSMAVEYWALCGTKMLALFFFIFSLYFPDFPHGLCTVFTTRESHSNGFLRLPSSRHTSSSFLRTQFSVQGSLTAHPCPEQLSMC